MTTTTNNLWEMLENPPKYAKRTAELFSWSLNYDYGHRPFYLFLDMVGWTEENGIGKMYAYDFSHLGYMEIDHLGDALKEYADKPSEVTAWVDALMASED